MGSIILKIHFQIAYFWKNSISRSWIFEVIHDRTILILSASYFRPISSFIFRSEPFVSTYTKNLVINFSICPDLALSLILVLRLSLINLSFWWTRNKNSLTLELSFLVLIDHIIKNHDTFFRKYYIRYEMSTIFRQ